VIDEHRAHRARGQREEVLAVPERRRRRPEHAHVRFVEQRRRLQRVLVALRAHLSGREAIELLIDERQELSRRRRIARLDAIQEARNVAVGLSGQEQAIRESRAMMVPPGGLRCPRAGRDTSSLDHIAEPPGRALVPTSPDSSHEKRGVARHENRELARRLARREAAPA
jgi:hypothetical protein